MGIFPHNNSRPSISLSCPALTYVTCVDPVDQFALSFLAKITITMDKSNLGTTCLNIPPRAFRNNRSALRWGMSGFSPRPNIAQTAGFPRRSKAPCKRLLFRVCEFLIRHFVKLRFLKRESLRRRRVIYWALDEKVMFRYENRGLKSNYIDYTVKRKGE